MEKQACRKARVAAPPKVRRGMRNRPLEVDDMLRGLKIPVLVTHGAEDQNVKVMASEYTAKMIAGARLSVYQGVGHSPFFEDARDSMPNLPPLYAAPRR